MAGKIEIQKKKKDKNHLSDNMDSSQSSQSGRLQMDYDFNAPELGQAYYKEKDGILSIGAGKPMPRALPDVTEYVVEFNGPDDPAHPLNWNFLVKYTLPSSIMS